MSLSRRALGEAGESIAARLLAEQGMRVVARNVRFRLGEIDLVAWDGPTLVFVEVRTRRGTGFGTPLESVDLRKQKKLNALARAYLQSHGLANVTCRFDVVGITYVPGEAHPRVEHVRDAFSA